MKRQVVAFAEAHGFSERSIERAFHRLGDISATVGRQPQWRLPPYTSATSDESGDGGD